MQRLPEFRPDQPDSRRQIRLHQTLSDCTQMRSRRSHDLNQDGPQFAAMTD
jgi:hypothetical protein